MGNSHGTPGDLKLVNVATDSLKDRLNKVYDALRSRPATLSNSGLFDYLWEMKELALLEGRSTVPVPTTWLEELEDSLSQLDNAGRGH
jgi:hypothetical protein